MLGANDGIVSTAGLVVGVAGAAAQRQELLVAGVAGLVAFAFGALLPLLAIALPPVDLRVPVTMAAVTAALVTGWVGARLGQAPVAPALARNVGVGLLAMGLTFIVGLVVGPGVG